LTAHGIPVELLDVSVDFGIGSDLDGWRVVCQRVARYLADRSDDILWLGISCVSASAAGMMLGQEISAALPGIPILLGGYFASCSYRQLLRGYDWITAIVRGDGEASALEISRCQTQGRPFLSEQTPNLAWLDQGEIHTAPVQPIDLDELPILDFRLLRNPSFYRIATISTSRGCPFRCNYCLESKMRRYAAYSVDWVDQQLAHLETHLPKDRVFIYDPIFGVGRERTLKLCDVLSEHHFGYAIESRVDVLSPDLIPALRRAGVDLIEWGIESASPETLARMNKIRAKANAEKYLNQAMAVLQACFENDVTALVTLMLGYPGDTETDCQVTLEFAQRIRQQYDRTGNRGGLVFGPQRTRVHEGSALAASIGEAFPDTVLRPESSDAWSVLAPSPGLTRELLQHYHDQMAGLSPPSPRALKLMDDYFGGFSVKDFADRYPDQIDAEGVIALSKDLHRLGA
jgi:radical SAM superfamily enzyme YgiQ (UPF0313 family)